MVLESISLIDSVGLFVFIAGFVIGLGAVIVIDLHGFLAQRSAYWTEATIRTHKVTKPLIWVGIFLVFVGGVIVYRGEAFAGIPLMHAVIAGLLILNGLFLSFVVSPYLLRQEKEGRARELLPQRLQNKIVASFIVSALGWWGGLVLFVLYIVQKL